LCFTWFDEYSTNRKIFGKCIWDRGVENMITKRDTICPMKKMGDAWDVAYAALFLASDEAKILLVHN